MADVRSVTFTNSLGYKLVAELVDAGKNTPVVVFSHGRGSGRKSPRSLPISEALLTRGISSLLVDLTGHGDSEGTMEEATTDQWADDLKNAIGHLSGIGFTVFGLSGASYGGASALMCAAEEPRVKAIVLRYSTMQACFSFQRPCYELAQKIAAPTLLIVGELDHPILEENRRFLGLLNAPKSMHVIPGAVHAFEEPEQIQEAALVSLEWYAKYLPSN